MFIFLSKVLAPLCLPLGLALILLIGAFVWARRVRVARALIGAVVIGLWVLATPACGNRMLGGLERRYPLRPAAAEPAADAIVVLGGGTTGRGPDQPEVELGSSGTRLLHAYRLYRAGKARVLILSGGNIASEQAEADQMREVLAGWGVPGQAMLLEPDSRNTHENAVYSTRLAHEHGLRRLILVTSAFHMPRALAVFRHEAAPWHEEVVPSSAGMYSNGRQPFSLLDYFPDDAALGNSTLALRERLGSFVYHLRGWM